MLRRDIYVQKSSQGSRTCVQVRHNPSLTFEDSIRQDVEYNGDGLGIFRAIIFMSIFYFGLGITVALIRFL